MRAAPASLAVLTFAFAASLAAAAPPALTPQPFVTGFAFPLEIVAPDDATNRLFVVEQTGRIRIIRNGAIVATPFLDLSGSVIAGGEEGLLGLAFHPQFASNGFFFVYYTRPRSGDPGGDEIVIERFQRSLNPDVGDAASGVILLVIQHPQFANHQSGKLAFGPDGYLYASVGDGGGGGDPFMTGQNLGEFRGKILRFDVDGGFPYAIPATNPFAGSSDPGVHKEIWDYGLRNAWRFSFDRLTGDLLIADVGQNLWEEIDFEPAGSGGGRNYGWSIFEATHCFNPPTGCSLANHTLPVIEYGHNAAGGFSVTGGYRYRGTTLPALSGYYVYGDYVSGHLWAASPDSGGLWTTTQVGQTTNPSAFGQDASGELYVTDLGAGAVLRLTPAATTIPRMVGLSTRLHVATGDDVLIGGLVIQGTASKTVVLRARGPSLVAAGVANPLANPVLQLFSGSTPIASNDDWGAAPNAAQITASGFAPSDVRESAIMTTLAPGAYTAIVTDAAGGSGVGLIEMFEVDHPERPLAAISTRAQVLTGDNVMIGGFIIQGTAPQTVIVRARGPSLAAAGVTGVLANPTLQLVRSSDQAVIAANDDWQDDPNAAEIAARGFAPGDALESALLVTLAPGAYTAVVSGVGGTSGVGIVEVFAQ